MFTSIPSLDPIVQCLLPAFTQPSFQTHVEVFLGWVMCLSKRTEYGVFQTIQADTPISRKQRHPFDRFYNFFSRSAWTVHNLDHEVAVAVVVRLNPCGGPKNARIPAFPAVHPTHSGWQAQSILQWRANG